MEKHPQLTSLILICLLFLLILHVSSLDKLPKPMKIISSPVVSQDVVYNTTVCFADCSSCQPISGDCQTCFEPWFQLRNKKCELAFGSYTLESTQQQQRHENFIPSSEWSYNDLPVNSQVCTPDPIILNKNITIIGPFTNGSITYERTISQHNYFMFKFMLILINWTDTVPQLHIKVKNQINTIIVDQKINILSAQVSQSYLQKMCSSTPIDRRVAVFLQIYQQYSSQLSIQIDSSMSEYSSWGLSSFVLVTGSCNQSCASCKDYTPELKSCDICKNFLAPNNDLPCSSCLSGYTYISSQKKCKKCGIQFKQCEPPEKKACQYEQLTLSNKNCQFKKKDIFYDRKQVTEQKIFSSLFYIEKKGGRIINCGSYSIVGPAKFGQIISRNYLILPFHIEVSVSFNIFIFDQADKAQRYSVVILIDDQVFPLEAYEQTINIIGTSNQCDKNQSLTSVIKYQAFQTFSTKKFMKHKKTQNVALKISLGTSVSDEDTKWGIRDIRLVFKRCDDNCVKCGQKGCQVCKGLLQIQQGQCTQCLMGTGLNKKNLNCELCPLNCMQCQIKEAGVKICTKCFHGYYLFKEEKKIECLRNPIYGENLQIIGPHPESLCNLNEQNTTLLLFNQYTNKYITNELKCESNWKSIQFYLVAVDQWEGDFLDIYANGYLLQRVQNKDMGSNFCGNDDGDLIFYKSYKFFDTSPIIVLEFEAVHKNISKNRTFGIGNFSINPIGQQYSNFSYWLKYNYDEALFILVQFNKKYEINDENLFKNIFILKIDNKNTNYRISSNDSIRYWLQVQIDKQILFKNATLVCMYPEKVFTNSNINNNTYFDARMLQQTQQSLNYKDINIISNNNASVHISRYSPLRNRKAGIIGLQTFFSVICRIIIYVGFASFFFGFQTAVTHLMHNIQKLWLHIYVASLALSPVLKTALWGFIESQDQNIAINPRVWQQSLSSDYYFFDTPAVFQQYFKDTTFFRHIYNVGVAFLIFTVIYVIIHLILKAWYKKQTNNGQEDQVQKLKNRLHKNKLLNHFFIYYFKNWRFYFYSILYYQYLTVVVACYLQFLDLTPTTKTQNNPTATVNIIASIIAFAFATIFPIGLHLFIYYKGSNLRRILRSIFRNNKNNNFHSMQVDLAMLEQQHFLYANRFYQVFFRTLPSTIWQRNFANVTMISEKYILYNLFRYGDLWWQGLICVLMHYSAFAQAFLLVITNAFHLAIVLFSGLNRGGKFRILKSIELFSFAIIEILIIVMVSLNDTLRYESFEILGIISLVFVILILIISIFRALLTGYNIYKDEIKQDQTEEQSREKIVRKFDGYERNWHPDLRGVKRTNQNEDD